MRKIIFIICMFLTSQIIIFHIVSLVVLTSRDIYVENAHYLSEKIETNYIFTFPCPCEISRIINIYSKPNFKNMKSKNNKNQNCNYKYRYIQEYNA